MTPNQFKKKLEKLDLGTADAARELRVSRFAIMHWRAGRRAIPDMVAVALEAIELRRKYAARRLTGTGNIGTERRQHATACAVIPMTGRQIRCNEGIEPLLAGHSVHLAPPLRDGSIHRRGKRLDRQGFA